MAETATKPKRSLTKVQKHTTSWSLLALLVVSGILAVFFALAKEVRDTETLGFDKAVLEAIHGLGSTPFTDALVVAVTNTSGPLIIPIVTIAIAGVLWFRRKQLQALKLVLGVGGASVIGMVLKNIFLRARPDLWERIVTEHTFSFPSGHAIASSAFAASVVFALWHTKWRITSVVIGVVYVLLIGFTRLYLGIHYPTDILAGWLVGLGWVLLVSNIYVRSKKKQAKSVLTKNVNT